MRPPEAARPWLGEILPEIIRETGIGAAARVERLRQRGGVPAVLAEIGLIRGPGAKRTYYDALLDGKDLSDDDLVRVLRQAGHDLAASSGALRMVLSKAHPSARAANAAREAVGDAVDQITSDADRTAVLMQYAMTGDREMLLLVSARAKGIESDGDKARLLATVVARYLVPNDSALRQAFFEASATLVSDGDEARVLSAAIPFAHAAPAITRDVIEATRRIGSSGDKARVLTEVAQQHLLTTRELRNAYLDAARTISSDHEYRLVMDAAITP